MIDLDFEHYVKKCNPPHRAVQATNENISKLKEYDDSVKVSDWVVIVPVSDGTSLTSVKRISDMKFKEAYEQYNPRRHSVGTEGFYPKFVPGDIVVFRGFQYEVIQQHLSYDGDEIFWGDVDARRDGQTFSFNNWQLELWVPDEEEGCNSCGDNKDSDVIGC